jgi:hypothetical protein
MALWRIVTWPLAAVGVATLALGALLAQPVKSPPPLESIHSGAMAIPRDGKPELSRFQALAGLWFGAAFAALGLGLSALALAGYLWSGEGFNLWLAAVNGGGFILCGLWMRRT